LYVTATGAVENGLRGTETYRVIMGYNFINHDVAPW